MKKLILLVSLTFIFFSCAKSVNEPGKSKSSGITKNAWESDYTEGNLQYTSAYQIVTGDSAAKDALIASVTPIINDDKIPYYTAWELLRPIACLGYWGPLGAYGPLGVLGPIGDNSWNLEHWMKELGDWSDHRDDTTGPLSPLGPLGENGPVSYDQYHGLADPGLTLFSTNDFAVQLRALGLWTVVGPIGPLGALGPLGPLGPVGAHGYAQNSDGEYVHNGDVQRDITINYNAAGDQRTYELFEKYYEAFAEAKVDNDTSFMVIGESETYEDVDTYSFTSAHDQIVTVLLVPEKELDDFDISLKKADGTLIERSDVKRTYMEWIQFKAKAGASFKVEVDCYDSAHSGTSTYRLIVVGSTQYLNQTNIRGDHIGTY